MNKLNVKKSMVLLISLTMVLMIAVGGTLAFLADTSEPVVDTFEPAYVTSEVNLSQTNNTITAIVKNTSNINAYIRAAVVVTWRDENNKIYWTNPSRTLSIDKDESKWEKGSDGYYYWPEIVAVGESISEKIVVTPTGTAPEGYTFTVEVLAEAIQAYGMNASSAQGAWANAK